MSESILGPSFDIHGGGQDLIFPHHENEIAQSVSLHGSGSFAALWIHNGILTVNGDKMSKSLGNFLTVEDLLKQAKGEVIRMALLMSHYRSSLDWTEESLPRAKASLDRLYRALEGLEENHAEDSPIDPVFLQALEDDLNTPLAIHRLHELANEVYQENNQDLLQQKKKTLKKAASLLGILQEPVKAWFQGTDDHQGLSSEIIDSLILQRKEAREKRDFATSDRIRQQLSDQGILLEDTPLGATWRRV
jgi:cysteinyl-tRNA synthetase